MTVMEMTPALRLAAELSALAQHLLAHPHLSEVRTLGEDYHLAHNSTPATNLVAWANSLKKPAVTVRNIGGDAFVHVTGGMGACQVTVWDVVPGLLAWMSMPRDFSEGPMGLKALRAFASDGLR